MDELQRLREENARLKARLAVLGVASEATPSGYKDSPSEVPHATIPLTKAERIALFRRLFHGRTDVYPLRWESAKGTSGYSPACGNEWKPGICYKPKVKCSECVHSRFLPVTDQVTHDHLSGKHTVGVYPLLIDDTCRFLAVDFDGDEWRDDADALMRSCREFQIPGALEISRSGNGAHVWIFFDEPVPANEARRLGAALISHTCRRTRQLSLASYDRLFPNQDTLPKGGFGNLIALPLQKQPRERDRSVFVDEKFEPYPDQWAYLASTRLLSRSDLEDAILLASEGRHPLDVSFVMDDEDRKPWLRATPDSVRLVGPLPEELNLVLANQIFIAKSSFQRKPESRNRSAWIPDRVRDDDSSKSVLPQPLLNRLIRLAAFQNPEFYKAQAMRLPVWNKPRIIGCAENFAEYVGLPRGCLDDILSLLGENNIRPLLQDERLSGRKMAVRFVGTLRKDQKAALRAIAKHDIGVCCAPPGFGKTVIAAALIARRKVSTLVLVHRSELLRQWQERLTSFLEISSDQLGIIGGGKKKPSGQIDIAVMQSLSRIDDLPDLLDGYGQIIADECHHLPAFSFESILKQSKARYVVGLTATPIRRDGHQPIIFMQCGPVRHIASRPPTSPTQLEVWPRMLPSPNVPADSPIQSVFKILTNDRARNRRITNDVVAAYRDGRKVLLLTERTSHLSLLAESLQDAVDNLYVVHGRLSRKKRAAVFAELEALDDSAPRVLLATGRLIGEGFDHPPLDTLVLAMPISWKGRLQQYAGRLHRYHAGKQSVRVYDYVEKDHPSLARMWDRRRKGYAAMGYSIRAGERTLFDG
ncbi:MAG: DEAD/DEAH box helicase family protein [Rhodothermales bacterium]